MQTQTAATESTALHAEVSSWLGTRRLLAALPSMAALRRARRSPEGRKVRIRCDRSLPFEFAADFLDPFLATWGARAELSYSDYDPGLAQLDAAGEWDARLLFLDWRLYADRLSPEEAATWVFDRAAAAVRASAGKAPVLLTGWPKAPAGHPHADWLAALQPRLRDLPGKVPGALFVDLEAVAAEVPGDPFDARNEAVAKFPFSTAFAIALARHLGADLLPPLLGERVKAVVLDLDDTLWRGVLGEDGAQGIRIGEGQLALFEVLRGLRQRGVVLALCSRNEREDVEAVFRARPELGLSLDDFASIRVNWFPKVENLRAIAADLNVLPSALLFVDDNDSELAKARGAIEGLKVLLADPDGVETAQALRHFPGLAAVANDSAAGLRSDDIRANREREKLKEQAGDLTQYLAALRMEVQLYRSHRPHAQRVYELSQKTNQFNLALARLSAAQADEAFGDDHVAMTVGLRDALSDSGLVGVLLARLEGTTAVVREVLFSCRVLGREVEAVALFRLCRWLGERGVETVRFEITEGPRNAPARDWLRRFVPEGDCIALAALQARTEEIARHHPAAVVEHP